MKKLYLILSLCFFILYITASNRKSILNNQNPEIQFINQLENDSLKIDYINNYINIAKKEGDNIKVIDGYFMMIDIFSHSEKGIKYSDSAVIYSQKLKKENSEYILKSHLKKGVQCYYIGKDAQALDNFLIVDSLARKQNNQFQKLVVRHYIGLLKSNHFERIEALNIFKENLVFFKKKENQINHKKQYLKSLYALADSYLKQNMLDSAEYYGKIGIRISKDDKSFYLQEFFLQQIGSIEFSRENYNSALDHFLKSSSFLKKKKVELASCYLMIARTYYGLDNIKLSNKFLLKVDSIYKEHPESIFYAREAYTNLYTNYKKDKTADEQLMVLNKILNVDSIIKTDYSDVSKDIIRKYDSRSYKQNKQILIDKLNNENKKLNKWLILIVVILVMISALLIYLKVQNGKYKQNYKKLIEKVNDRGEKVKDKIQPIENSNLDIGEEIIKKILSALDDFEEEKGFLDSNITASLLAKRFDTNTSYLSKVVNAYKKTNFSNYLKELRINYAIKKIQSDRVFRKYSVKAIAYEIGFNNVDSFSRAFYQITKIHPSYFIKQVNKEEKNTDNL